MIRVLTLSRLARLQAAELHKLYREELEALGSFTAGSPGYGQAMRNLQVIRLAMSRKHTPRP